MEEDPEFPSDPQSPRNLVENALLAVGVELRLRIASAMAECSKTLDDLQKRDAEGASPDFVHSASWEAGGKLEDAICDEVKRCYPAVFEIGAANPDYIQPRDPISWATVWVRNQISQALAAPEEVKLWDTPQVGKGVFEDELVPLFVQLAGDEATEATCEEFLTEFWDDIDGEFSDLKIDATIELARHGWKRGSNPAFIAPTPAPLPPQAVAIGIEKGTYGTSPYR